MAGLGVRRCSLDHNLHVRFVMTMLSLLVLCLLAPTLAAAQSLAPAGWDANLKLREAVDTNPDPKVVEITLAAQLAEVEIAAFSWLDGVRAAGASVNQCTLRAMQGLGWAPASSRRLPGGAPWSAPHLRTGLMLTRGAANIAYCPGGTLRMRFADPLRRSQDPCLSTSPNRVWQYQERRRVTPDVVAASATAAATASTTRRLNALGMM